MSFESCLLSERLTHKLPVAELRKQAEKFMRKGASLDEAMKTVLGQHLELARMEERSIIKAVRSAWEAKGGKPRQVDAARADEKPAIDPAPTARTEALERDHTAPNLDEMFTQLLAEEAAAKPASDDLNGMFDDLMAEVSGEDPRPTVAEVVADKPKKARGKKAAPAEKATEMAAPAQAMTGATTPEAHIRKFAKTPDAVPNDQVRKVLLDAGPLAPQVAAILGEQGHLVSAVGKAMEEMGYKFTGFDGLKPLFEKPGTRPAGEAAVSAAKNTIAGFSDAIDALGKLFGGEPGTFGSGPVFNDETYAKAKPAFLAAIKHFADAAADVRDVMKAIIKDVYAKYGRETTAKMQAYIVRFVDEYRSGKIKGEEHAAESAAGSAAGDQEHRADEKPAAEHDLFDVRGADHGSPPAAAGHADRAGDSEVDRAGVSGHDAAAGGEEGDQLVHDQKPGSDGRAAERGNAGGSGADGRAGARPERQAGSAAAGDARDGKGEDKLAQQRQAAAVPVKLGDRANIDATLPYLLEPQRGDVHFAEKRFAAAGPDTMPGVLFTNGTGTGKTATGGGIIARLIRAGHTDGMIVVPNAGIAHDWIEFGKRLGIDIKLLESTSDHGGSGATITTYANFGANKTLADRAYHWVLADESHNLMAAKDGNMTDALTTFRALTRHPAGFAAFSRMRNRDLYDRLGAIDNKESPEAKAIFEQLRARDEALKAEYSTKPEDRPKAVFLSATPFAYVKSVDYAEGYLFHYPEDGKIGNSNQDGRAKFFVQHFGYRIRYHKLTEPDGKVDVGLMARQFNSYLKNQGALSARMLDVPYDYGRRFMKIESALGEKVDEGLEFLRTHPEYKHLYQPLMKEFNYLRRRYLLEAIKAKEALPIIQQHLDMGRKVVVIHDYKKGGAFNPFTLDGIGGTTTAYDDSMSPKSIDLAQLADRFKAERPDLAQLSFPRQNALQTLQSAFPNALVHNGDIADKQLEQNKVLFNSDTSGRNIIILQSDKGREGISLHDTTGVHPRVEVIVGMAAKPTALIQLEGRVYRTGQKSNTGFDYVVTGTNWERWTFAQTIAERTDIAEALAMGDDARAMKDSIVEAFENAGPHPITENDFTGGKARDRQAVRQLTDWDRAKTYYYGQLKRNSGNKALEGKDYYATPEPVGLKMVEWADIRPGEDVLEPSAGHGAIARWFPTLSNKTVLERESGLISTARLHVDGAAKFIQGDFEDLNTVNKFDSIVMNPPFGRGGSDAIPHLAKAYEHLREGGRIVALLPRGPAADAKLEKFLHGDQAPKDLYMVADVELPGATFGRAGTGVMTHIVVLDKISDPGKAPQQVARSYASADDVEELFDRIQHSTIPGRVKNDLPLEVQLEQNKAAPKKQPRQAAPDATGAERYFGTFEFKHTQTGEDKFGAAVLNTLPNDTYKQVLSLAKKNGGYYNKFVGGGALRGFLFKSAEDRTAFMAEAGQLAEVSAGHDAMNSLTGDLGIDSRLIDHMESIADARGMMRADQLLPWVQQQSAPGAEKLANWLEHQGDGMVAQSSVVKFMEHSGNAMFSSMPTFYSALARTLPEMGKIAAKDGTVKAEQARLWLQSRQKEGKFKSEELQWSGVDDWLKAQGGRVSVDDIATFLEHNGVEVQEVQKGTTGLDAIPSYVDSANVFGDEFAVFDEEGRILGGTYARREEAEQAMEAMKNDQPTRYSQYTLPGGENYRELLLTLPSKADQHGARLQDLREKIRRGEATEGESKEYQSLLESWDNQADSGYQSSHWAEKNIVAHVRFNDRTDADGKRVLFIEELQSDWGQDGLKKGFKKESDPRLAKLIDKRARLLAEADAITDFGERMTFMRQIPPINAEINELGGTIQSTDTVQGTIPAAPFVTDTKAWLGLGIKRMIRYAAENGYDRVAFVNGEQSAARYDLSKQVDRILVHGRTDASTGERTRSVTIDLADFGGSVQLGIDKNGIIDSKRSGPGDLVGKPLEDVIGKEMAQRVMDADVSVPGGAEFSGDGLKMGGEGMKSFYDKIVPQTVNEVLKKVGGGKASPVDFSTPRAEWAATHHWEGPEYTLDQLRSALEVARKSGPDIRDNPLTGNRDMFGFNRTNNKFDLERLIKNMEEGQPFSEAVLDDDLSSHGFAELLGGRFEKRAPEDVRSNRSTQIGFDITPELREKALQGMPMFQRAEDPVNQGRRNLLALAAATAMSDARGKATTLGQVRPINPAVLDQRVSPTVEKILRRDFTGRQNDSGVTNMKGAPALREALRTIALTGPKELRTLAGQVARLLPSDGVMLTVDDTRRMNVHGVVELSPFVHMQLFTAEGRTGLTYGTIIHEAMHVAVAARYRSLSVGMARSNDKLLGLSAPAAAHALEQFEGVWNEFRTLTAGEKFTNRDLELAVTEARGNPDEFFVRALTDPLLQNYLAGKRYEGKTLFERFKDWVKTKLFGFMEDGGTAPSWLDAALAASGDVVQAMDGDRSDFARMKAINKFQASRTSENSRALSNEDEGSMAARALPSSWDMPDDTRMDKVIQSLQDTHIDTKRAVKAINEAMGDLGDKWDPYLQEELYHGRSATGIKDFLHDELRPLMVDMSARGVSLEQLQEFLHMRHAEEANDYLASINQGSPDGLAGVSTADAQAYLAGLAPAQLAKLTALAARVDAIQKATRQALVDYGLEKQSTIDTWDNTYQHYVPLHREDMEHGMMGNGTGSGFSVRGAASKARTGSKRAVVDILANVAMARERAIVRGEKNRIGMALYGLALQAPNPEFWKPINPQKNPAALDAELLGMGLSLAEKTNLGAEPRSRRVGKSGMVESYVNLAARNAPNVVAVRVGGEDRFLFFNKHDERAMRMAQAMKNLDTDTLGWVMGKVAWATRQFAAFNTQYNPIFGIVNLTRDTSEAAINLSSTPIAGKQHQVLAEAGKLLGKVILARGRLGNLKGADLALWHEFEKEGGITGFRAMFSRSEDRTAELRRELARMGRNPVLKAGGAIMDWLSDYNEALENITRLSAYKVAKENGLTIQRAASLAKNLTVNFNRKGAKTRQVGALYAFFNASVQGVARAAQTLSSKAGKLIIAGGLLLGAMQSTMLHVWGFDSADIPEFIQAKNLVIPASRPGHGKNYVTIPLPQGFAFLPSLGRISTDFALGGGKQAGKYGGRVLETLLDTFNPLGSSTILQTLSPTVTDPVAALAENKDWTGKPIAREDYSQLHPTPGFTRAKDTASAVGKFVAHAINSMTGGTDYAQGAVSPTPDQIDYLIGQFTGGVGREAMKAQQTGSSMMSGEDLPWNKVPLIGRFYGDVNDKSAISTRFYDNVKELADTAAEVDGRQKAHVSSKEYRASHPEWKLAEKSEVVLREVAELSQRRHHYLQLGNKARVKEYELKIRSRMTKFNEEVAAQQAAAQ